MSPSNEREPGRGGRRPTREPSRTILASMALALLLSLGVLLFSGCQSSEYGGGLDLERMVDQRRFDAYDASDLFADGMAMRTPPDGIVPFGEALPAAVRTGIREGEPVERIPVPLSLPVLAAGRESFEVYCAPCHGTAGDAATPVAAAMTLRPPPSLHEERIRSMPPGTLFRVATEGYGMMPGYRSQLDPERRWAVVAYVRALQLSRRVRLDSLPPDLRERALEELDGRERAPEELDHPVDGGDR